MDCNRDEALRAKEVAERKFSAKDIAGARKFALKAQNLFPELDGISQMVSTLNVYLAAEAKVNGENDWYAILSVNASTDDKTLKKHYRKLALQLHPDKNKSIGAEGAFKLISEAWSVLSDKTRKMAYDQKRNISGSQQKVSQSHKGHSAPGSANGFYDFAHTTVSTKKPRKSHSYATSSAATPPSHSANLNTFWTSCNRCRMQYEYLRIYLNHNLLCPNCHQAFMAVEIGIPANAVNSSVSWSAKQHQQNSNHNSTIKNGYNSGFSNSIYSGTGHTEYQHGGNLDSYNNQNFQWSSVTGTVGTGSTTNGAYQTASSIHRKLEKMRRKHEKAQAAARRQEELSRNDCVSKGAANGSKSFNTCGSYAYDCEQTASAFGRPAKRKMSNGGGGCIDYGRDETGKNGDSEKEKANGCFADSTRTRAYSRQNNLSKELSQINIHELLMEKVKASISKKLAEWDLACPPKLAAKVKSQQKRGKKDNDHEQQASTVDGNGSVETCLDDSQLKNSPHDGHISLVHKTIDVPDPDFYDFDKDRLERTFEGDQVWATYDNEDGMPRFYVLVQKVLSLKPFKIRMSFLNSKSNNDLGPMNWVGSGFHKTCGEFRVGRYQICETVNIFSHRVRWEKGPRGVIKILPKKGDTWALYRNWSPDWNELTPDDVIYKYEMVEVLDDYNHEHGVSVTPLVKVAGFKAVFHRHLDQKEVKRIPREEIFRFSHQVPSYLLTGDEAHNALKGCCELDPAATPVDLLQVITDLKDDVGMETS